MVLPVRKTKKARIEIIPMIDVVFFLLVFFMMASLAMSVSSGLPVSLPEAASAEKSQTETVAISLTNDGGLFVDKEPVAPGGLGAKIQPGLAKNKDLAVVIHADRDVAHSRVVDALDELRQLGVTRIAIAVAPKSGAPAKTAAATAAAPTPRAAAR